jgi:beta-glucosidase
LKTNLFALGFAALLVFAPSIRSADDNGPRYLDANLSPEERAADLVSRLTLEEKVRQMQNAAPAIPRLGIPAYEWWNEGLHGVARAGLATVFPQAIGLAATWDTQLEQSIAAAISTEARAKYNDAMAHGNHRRYYGLTFWSPNINIFRDPRWGRGQETFGEDPFLTSEMALAFIHGMQGNDPKYFKTIATSKHFAVHSGPEVSRHQFDAQVSTEDLDETYLYAFRKTLTAGGAYSVMCAYNRVEGAPACASDFLLKDKLRSEWKFPGYVVSDCGAVSDIFDGHHMAASMAEAVAMAVKAGTDLTCGDEYQSLVEAVKRGLISEDEIDQSLRRLLVARFRLGLFDPPARVPYANIGADQIANVEHEKLALKAAEESMVLLKNENHLLPLSNPPASLAVIGPASDDPDVMLGNYYGTPRHLITPLAGIQQKFAGRSQIRWALGSVYASSSTALVPPSALTPKGGAAGENGVLAEYFRKQDFSGEPLLTRIEPRGYFVWAMNDPAVMKALPAASFAVRWSFVLRVPVTGEYELGLARQECDSCEGTNSWRLTLDGKKLFEDSRPAAGGQRTLTRKIHLDAAQPYQARVEYVQQEGGSGVELVWAPPAESALAEAVAVAARSDLTILCIGLSSRLEGEESPIQIPGFAHGDRTNIDLPAPQEKLLNAVLDTGKPVVVVLLNGSALAVTTANKRAAAILEAWYGGQEGGSAIANTLSGDNNPAGRLPITFYQSSEQLPPFSDYSMLAKPAPTGGPEIIKGRTYRFFEGRPLYPFGYGLSYSTFEYSNLKLRKAPDGKLLVSVRVQNTSPVAGDEVAQLYLGSAGSGAPWLKGFERVHFAPGEANVLHWTLEPAEIHGNIVTVGGTQPRYTHGVQAIIPNH